MRIKLIKNNLAMTRPPQFKLARKSGKLYTEYANIENNVCGSAECIRRSELPRFINREQLRRVCLDGNIRRTTKCQTFPQTCQTH